MTGLPWHPLETVVTSQAATKKDQEKDEGEEKEKKKEWEKEMAEKANRISASLSDGHSKGESSGSQREDCVLFANSTCFTPAMMQQLADMSRNMPAGTIFITLTHKLPSLSEGAGEGWGGGNGQRAGGDQYQEGRSSEAPIHPHGATTESYSADCAERETQSQDYVGGRVGPTGEPGRHGGCGGQWELLEEFRFTMSWYVPIHDILLIHQWTLWRQC